MVRNMMEGKSLQVEGVQKAPELLLWCPKC